MNKIYKYLFLLWFGGATYCTLEVLWRGYSHWTMFILSGVLFVIIGLLNEIWSWDTSLLVQAIVATFIATMAEFICGCIVNIYLGWGVWDYSDLPLNFMGQICLEFTALWFLVSIIAIILDDTIRWKFFDEEKPRYKL